jgi:hypothetical protein
MYGKVHGDRGIEVCWKTLHDGHHIPRSSTTALVHDADLSSLVGNVRQGEIEMSSRCSVSSFRKRSPGACGR